MTWVLLACGVCLLQAVLDVSYRSIYHHRIPVEQMVIGTLLVGTLVLGLAFLAHPPSRQNLLSGMSATSAARILLAGVLVGVVTYLWRRAQVVSPNIGFVNAIVAASILITIPAVAWIYGDRITPRAYAGAALVLLGLILIVT